MEKPEANYSDEMLGFTKAREFFQGEGQYLNTYIKTDVRPLIMAYASPTDDAVSFYWLTLPREWNENNTNYPLYLELYRSGGFPYHHL